MVSMSDRYAGGLLIESGILPLLKHACGKAKRLAGVTPEVNLRECISHRPLLSLNKSAHSGFQTQRRRHQKCKTGVSVAPHKGLMSSKYFLKKEVIASHPPKGWGMVKFQCKFAINLK